MAVRDQVSVYRTDGRIVAELFSDLIACRLDSLQVDSLLIGQFADLITC